MKLEKKTETQGEGDRKDGQQGKKDEENEEVVVAKKMEVTMVILGKE